MQAAHDAVVSVIVLRQQEELNTGCRGCARSKLDGGNTVSTRERSQRRLGDPRGANGTVQGGYRKIVALTVRATAEKQTV
jgi:hypothetical protein